jgi:glucose/arabinose dehydrogenase
MRCARPAVLMGVATLLLAACGTSGGSSEPTWVPSPGAVGEGPGGRLTPIVPVPSGTGGGSGGGTASAGPSNSSPVPSPSGTKKVDPLVVATHLTAPVGLAMLPDGTALVGERTTGRIVRVQPVAGRPVPKVRTLSGLDASGDGGLLDLAVSPTYAQDNLIYAYITTRTDNRVVDFTLNGPVAPVITGIPKGRTGNTGRLMFGSDGDLYVGTGDAGRPALAADDTSLAGKVLRVDDIGDPAKGNPAADSPIWTTGHRVVDGLCALPEPGLAVEVETGATGSADEVNVLSGGERYGFPGHDASEHRAAATMPSAYGSPGGCAVQARRLWVTSLDGKALLAAPLAGRGEGITVGRFSAVLKNTYGRLRTVVAAADGAVWMTTSNQDGKGTPVADDERVIRYVAAASGGNDPV